MPLGQQLRHARGCGRLDSGGFPRGDRGRKMGCSHGDLQNNLRLGLQSLPFDPLRTYDVSPSAAERLV